VGQMSFCRPGTGLCDYNWFKFLVIDGVGVNKHLLQIYRGKLQITQNMMRYVHDGSLGMYQYQMNLFNFNGKLLTKRFLFHLGTK